MATPFKIVLIVFGALLLLVVAAAVALPLLFDPNQFRGRISTAVQDETGRELTVGNLGLKVFPWLQVAIDEARLGNAAGFGDDSFAEVRQLSVGVKLLPLLFERKVEVSSIRLDGLRLNLAVNAQGVSNWQDLLDRQAQKEDAPDPQAETPSQIRLEDIDISGIDITDAAIRYSDAKSGQSYRIESLRLETGAFKPGTPFDLDLGLTALADATKTAADLTLVSTVVPSLDRRRIEFKDARLGFKVRNGTPQVEAEGQLDAGIVADLDANRIDVGNARLEFKTRTGAPAVEAQGALATDLAADLAEQVLTLKGLKLDATATGEAIPGGKQTLKLAGAVRFDQKAGGLTFDDGRIEVAGISATAQIRGEGLNGDQPKLAGPIAIAPFSPRQLLNTLGITLDTADAQALSSASLKAQYSGTFKSASLRDLQLRLDDTTVQGQLAVTDFASQALTFALRADTLDADRYLPPKSAGDKGAKPGDQTDVNQIKLPTEALDALNANGTLDVARLTLNGMQLSDVRLKLSGSGSAAKTQDLSAKLYGGTLNLSNRYDRGGAPAFALKTDLNALSAAPFLQDLLGKDYVSGLGNVSVDLTSRGATVGELRKALNGTVAVKVENGAVKGFNLAQILRQGQAMLAGQAAPAETVPLETDFATLTASAAISNGILKTNDLAAASPAFRLAGGGQIDLVNETIRFTARPTVVETAKGQGGKGLDQLKGLTVPIEISGNLFSPKYKLDLEDVLKDKAKQELRNQLAKELDLPKDQASEQQLKEKAAEKLGDLLFGSKKKKNPAPTAEPAATPTPAT